MRRGDGNLYTGITTDIARRLKEHQTGGARCAKYLRGKGPLKLVKVFRLINRASAQKLEHRVKRLAKNRKEELVAGHLSLTDILPGDH